MASISTIDLNIAPDPQDFNKARVRIKYTITGSAFDIASGQPYAESTRLIGDDTPSTFPFEDGVDDQLAVLLSDTVVFTAAQPTRDRSVDVIVTKASLN